MEKIAKEIGFEPFVRVIIPKGGCNGYSEDEYTELVAREKLRTWTKEEILDWLFENIDMICESVEPYDVHYDD